MKKNMSFTNKLFLENLPDYISQDEISEIFSKSKIKVLRQNNISTALILSSEPVDSQVYLSMIHTFQKSGIKVHSFYFDTPDAQHIDTLWTAVNDLHNALTTGSCVVISYRSRFALPLIACLHILNGNSVEDAITALSSINKDSPGISQYRFLLDHFKEYVLHPFEDASKIRDAIKIDRSGTTRMRAADTLMEKKIVKQTRPSPPASRAGKQQPPVEKASSTIKDKKAIEAKGPISNDKPVDAKTPAVAYGGPSAPFYRSIRFKLITIISFIIIASLTGMIFLASYFFKNDNKVRVQESNLQISEVIALKIKSEIEKYQLMASVVFKEKAPNVSGYDDLISSGQKDILYTGIVKRSGKNDKQSLAKNHFNKILMSKFMISESDITALKDANMKIYALSFAGEHTISNISPGLNVAAFALSFPYERDAAGAVTSIIVSYIRLDNLLKTFKTTGITKVFMVNYKGDLIAHPDSNAILTGANYSSVPICSMMMKSKIDNGQTRYRDDSGIYYMGSFKKIDLGGFGIIATAKEKEAFEAVYKIQDRNMIIMGIVLVSAIMVIFFFGKTITTPIIRLVGATKKIINGQYQVDIVPTTKDEIGQLTSTFIEMGKGLEEREKIKSAFGKFVNKEIAEAALRDDLRLGGERKKVAILFSDIRSFTAISEKLEPEEVVEFLNSYMTKMVACVEMTNGIVDKFMGDAIMAVWGTPISRGNDTENAINSALLMRRDLIEFNKDRGGVKKPLIQIGCGINTGTVLAGQIGSENRMEYTVIGDPVNLASRIEALNKPFGTDILIGEDTYRLVKDIYAVEKMKQIRVKGKIEPQQIYAVLGRADDPSRPKSVKELQTLLGLQVSHDLSDEALDQMINRGEEKYEIIEK
jgi:adenylate cyclase